MGRLIGLLAGAVLCARATVDPDLWGHLTFGRDIVASLRITSVDPYSFMQDVRWTNHEWLSEVIFALTYRVGGIAGLLVLKTLLIAVVLTSAWAVLAPVHAVRRWWLFALLAFALAPAATTFRPQLWTLVALALIIRVLCLNSSSWTLVPLFAVWANLHGGWIVGAGVVGASLVGRAIDDRAWRSLAGGASLLGACVLATLINPYGVGLWRFVAGTVRGTREITEWRPLWQQADASHAVLWVVVTGVLVLTLMQQRGRTRWAAMLPAAGLCIGALWVDRLGPLFALVSTAAWREGWADALGSNAHAEPDGAPAASRLFVDLAAVAALWLVVAGTEAICLPISGAWIPDLAAAGALQTAPPGRLVLPFDWGEYAIWHWGPRLRVFTDGRRETVYSSKTIALQDAVADGRPEGVDYLLRERPEYVWLKQQARPVSAALQRSGYRLDVSTPTSFIAVRGDLPPLAGASPMPGCFP